jgi:hypothetical protein
MEFSTIVVIVLVVAVGYVVYKAFVKKADTNQDGVVTAEEAKVAVKEVEAQVVETVKKTATKAKTAVKKTATIKPTTRKPKAK